jgi:hypothetical protein
VLGISINCADQFFEHGETSDCGKVLPVQRCEHGVGVEVLADDDEVFFRLVYPAFWSIDSPEERLACERASVLATADTKVAKVFPVGETMWASIELFCPTIEAAQAVFPRCMAALRASVVRFVEAMRG